ncbi:MAG: hypothetical protein AB8G22_07935 [Saprospiraceae bacterium]
MANNDSKQRIIAIAAIAIVLLLLGNIYFLYNNYQKDEVIEQQTQSIDEAEKLKVELEKQYYEALSELEEMRGGNEELNALIEKQKSELEAQKNKISRLIRNGKDLTAARSEMKTMTAQLQNYVAENDNLKAENVRLSTSVDDLTNRTSELEQNLDQSRTEAESLGVAKAALEEEKRGLEEERADLSQKVNIASIVKVDEITVTGFKSKKNGKAVKKKYAKNIDHLRVCFNANENKVTPTGNERFFIRIVNPLGETLAVETLGSGIMRNEESGEQVRYTQSKDTEYNQQEENLCMIWQPNVQFSKGAYEVEIYNKGYLSGTGGFTLK